MIRPPLLRLVAWMLLLFAARAAAAEPAEQLQQLFDDAWQFQLREDPLFATFAGDHRYNDRLPDVSLAAQSRQHEGDRAFLARLLEIPRDQLAPAEQVNYDIFARLKRDQIAEYEFESYLMPITGRTGFHISFPELAREVPLVTVRDYENYIARLNAFGKYADQHIDLMRRGLDRGFVLPADVLRGYADPLLGNIVEDPHQSLLYEPLVDFPPHVGAADQERLRKAGAEAIAGVVVPAYKRFYQFMTDEYVPQARTQVGASALPNGRAFYRHRVKHYTTLPLEPQEVHDIGQAEVKRIRAEMDAIIKRVGFEGDFAKFVEHLRTDPKFYAATPEQLLKETSLVLKRMDGELPKLFKTLPRTPYGIREVPAYIASQTTTAYYQPPAGDGTRAGYYYVNTSNLKSRPLYEIEALSLHEAVPGHHLQIALQQELTGMPQFRRFAGFTAFVEGWGLYAERLGLESGFYEDPYRDFGRLSYEMWRACRLVVDTGMHYLGWTRQQAIDFMAENSALTLHNITTEVDRYIGWPGQALAYKIGELTIRQQRELAEKELGDKFDVREFHDVVLGSGGVPLDVLGANVKAWMDREKSAEKQAETAGSPR
ncbi:MAG: DUF885 domain-containing protein [Planctomycetaceae bacterium]|nr:DUF885 domain-containing protein [Planctomycetaceae bacterium]